MYVAFVLPHWFLAEKCQDFDQDVDKFHAGHMPRLLDTMESKLEEIVSDPSNFVKKDFMMKVFDTYKSSIQTFREYIQYLFEDKMSPNFDKSDKINRLKEYVEELFDPKDETNKKTTKLTMEFGKIAAQAWLDEFRKKGNGKNTFKYLQSTDGELAFDKFNAEELEKFINLLANNNPSEEGWGIASAEYFG